MGLSRTGSEACLVYTVLGTLGRRAGPPSSAGRLFVVSIRRSCTSDPAWYMMVSNRVSNESILESIRGFYRALIESKMPGERRAETSQKLHAPGPDDAPTPQHMPTRARS